MRAILVLAAVLSALATSACASEKWGGEATVAEVVENIHRWDGQIYVVRGWLGKCEGLNCMLHATEEDAQTVSSDILNDDWQAAMDRSLSVASIGDFDERAAPYQFQEVKITALVNAECRGWNGGCLDRAPDLVPFSIEPLSLESKAK